MNNDIGIITIPAVEFSNFIRPIVLPPFGSQALVPLENEQGTIVGFGGNFTNTVATTTHLRASFQRVNPAANCNVQHPSQNFCAQDTTQNS